MRAAHQFLRRTREVQERAIREAESYPLCLKCASSPLCRSLIPSLPPAFQEQNKWRWNSVHLGLHAGSAMQEMGAFGPVTGACQASSPLGSGAQQVRAEHPRAQGLEPREGAANQVLGHWSPRASGGCHVVCSPPDSSEPPLQTGVHSRGTCLHPSRPPRDASLSPLAQHVHAHPPLTLPMLTLPPTP